MSSKCFEDLMMITKEKDKFLPALSFDFLTPLYDPLIRLLGWETTFKSELRRQAAALPGERVLDLACGTATLTMSIKRDQPASEVHGLDGDGRILATARQKAEAEGAEINFVKAYSTAMPYSNDFFDSVLTSLFFHHLTAEEKKKTLVEILRVLKPGGRLYIADWGAPANLLMKLAQQPVILLDGMTTIDSFEGKLPAFAREAGFQDVTETGVFNTIGGTVRLHQGRKR